MNPLFFAVLLVMTLAAYIFFFLKLRDVERRAAAVSDLLDQLRRTVAAAMSRPAEIDAERLWRTLDALETASRETRQSADGSAAEIDALAASLRAIEVATSRLAERLEGIQGVVERPAAVDSAGALDAPPAPAAVADAVDIVRGHLESLGLAAIEIDGRGTRSDGSDVIRARGLRGTDLWSGQVVVRDGVVLSAAETAARMFP